MVMVVFGLGWKGLIFSLVPAKAPETEGSRD